MVKSRVLSSNLASGLAAYRVMGHAGRRPPCRPPRRRVAHWRTEIAEGGVTNRPGKWLGIYQIENGLLDLPVNENPPCALKAAGRLRTNPSEPNGVKTNGVIGLIDIWQKAKPRGLSSLFSTTSGQERAGFSQKVASPVNESRGCPAAIRLGAEKAAPQAAAEGSRGGPGNRSFKPPGESGPHPKRNVVTNLRTRTLLMYNPVTDGSWNHDEP